MKIKRESLYKFHVIKMTKAVGMLMLKILSQRLVMKSRLHRINNLISMKYCKTQVLELVKQGMETIQTVKAKQISLIDISLFQPCPYLNSANKWTNKRNYVSFAK